MAWLRRRRRCFEDLLLSLCYCHCHCQGRTNASPCHDDRWQEGDLLLLQHVVSISFVLVLCWLSSSLLEFQFHSTICNCSLIYSTILTKSIGLTNSCQRYGIVPACAGVCRATVQDLDNETLAACVMNFVGMAIYSHT